MKKLFFIVFFLLNMNLKSQIPVIVNHYDVQENDTILFFSDNFICQNYLSDKFLLIIVQIKLVDGKVIYNGLRVLSTNFGDCIIDSELTFIFKDGQNIVFKNWNPENCEGDSWFDRDGKHLDLFTRKGLRYIRFKNLKTSKFYTYKCGLNKNYFHFVRKVIDENNYSRKTQN